MPLPLTAFNRRLFALLAWLFLWSAAGAQTTDRAANYDPTQPAMATAVVAVPAAPPVESAHRAFIWEVSSPGNTVYLFGTIHVGKRSFYPLPE